MTLLETIERWFMGPVKPALPPPCPKCAELDLALKQADKEYDELRTKLTVAHDANLELSQTIEEAITVLTGDEPRVNVGYSARVRKVPRQVSVKGTISTDPPPTSMSGLDMPTGFSPTEWPPKTPRT